MTTKNSADSFSQISDLNSKVCEQVNAFCKDVLQTRGGRVGSGMGGLLEALWGYHANLLLRGDKNQICEVAWFPDHQFYDFACVDPDDDWHPETKAGEHFRIEAKSMSLDAVESKAHFDILKSEADPYDALLLLVWRWEDLDGVRCFPRITDCIFVGVHSVVDLRDSLHLKRGGTFVDKNNCPDGCSVDTCSHNGEPLNEKGSRERLAGPNSTRPSQNVSHSANFGGLVRMLKTRSDDAKTEFRRIRNDDENANEYISFIHRNLPQEELHHFSIAEWRQIASALGIEAKGLSKPEIQKLVREQQSYMNLMKGTFD